MSTDPTAIELRTKILGAMMRNARLKANLSIEACAEAAGLSAEELEKYELGEKAISLPELEMVAYHLRLPAEYFWGREASDGKEEVKSRPEYAALIRLRHRMVGAMLRQARLENGLSTEELSSRLGIEASRLESYELGLEPVPLPILEALTGELNRSVREFQDQKGPVGQWNAQQRALQDFMSMPLEMQTFISKPINRPYLDLAIRLSEMSVDRLRAVAEGLLEITY